jgi:hypothetical protein
MALSVSTVATDQFYNTAKIIAPGVRKAWVRQAWVRQARMCQSWPGAECVRARPDQ